MSDEAEFIWKCVHDCQENPCILIAVGKVTSPPLTCPWSLFDSSDVRQAKTVEWEQLLGEKV